MMSLASASLSRRRWSARCSVSLARGSAALARCSASATSFCVAAMAASWRSPSSRSDALAALGQLELEGLQLGLALLLGLGEQLGGGGPLLLGLAGGHVAHLDDLALGGGPEGGDLALGGGPVLGDLVVGDACGAGWSRARPRQRRVSTSRLAVAAQLVGLALGGVAGGLGLALGGGLDRGGDGPGLLDHLLRLEVGGGDQLLGLALGLVAVLVGLLLGQAEELLDPGAEPGQRGLGRSSSCLACSATLRSSSLMRSRASVVPVFALEARSISSSMRACSRSMNMSTWVRS